MARVVLNGLDVDKWITEVKPLRSDFDSEKSGRSVTGLQMRDRIGVKRKFQLTFGGIMSTSEIQGILNAVAPVFFNAIIKDGLVNTSGTYYASDREWEIVSGLEGYYKSLTFSIIER